MTQTNVTMSQEFKEIMDLFHVTPLHAKTSPKVIKKGVPKKFSKQNLAQRDAQAVMAESLAEDPHQTLHEIESDEEWRHVSLPIQKFRKLKRGSFHREKELNVRGYTVQEASTMIKNFINESVSAHIRCVRVIHGKGLNSPDGISKLKYRTQIILRQNRYVLAYCRAQPYDGEAGAKYVLLKKRK